MSDAYVFETDSLADQRVPLSQYKGRVLLIVDTASKCRFTPQYARLGAVYKWPHNKRLEVLGFPCNQFGKQEPSGTDEIGAFCEKNYGVSFPVPGKVDVNDSNAHPLCKWLILEEPGVLSIGAIKWNFTRFLPHRDDTVYKHYAPLTKPGEIANDIEWLLVEPDPV